MTTDQWMTLGIFTASVVFSVVGYLIVREIRANDRRFDSLEKKVERTLDLKSDVQWLLAQKGVRPKRIEGESE